MGLHVGGFIVWRGVLVAREPASRSVDKTSLSASRNADRLRNGLLRSVGACRLCVDRPRRRPRAPPHGPVGQLGRLSETPVAFAGAGRASTETVVAFVGAKWACLVHFSVAVVLPVSMVAVWGRAVVPVVSCWPAPVAAEVLLVSTSPRCRASCAKKFALHAQNTPKSAFLRVLGEFFRGNAAGGAVLGEFFRANRPCAQVL